MYNHRPTPTHQQPTCQERTHFQQNFSSIATDDVSLSNEQQNAISAVSVVQTSTSNTAKEFEFGSLHKELNLFETSGVRTPNLDMLVSALRTIQPTSTESERIFSVAGNFKTKIRIKMKFRVLDALVFEKYYFLDIF
jgi:hypothetical protein